MAAALAAAGFAPAWAQDGADAGPVREGPHRLDPREHRIGELIADVGFTDLEGKPGKLSDFRRSKALVIALSNVGCPVGKRYAPRLVKLDAEYGRKGVEFLLVNLSTQDTPEAMRGAVERYGFKARYVPDPEQMLGRELGVQTTTEVFVLDKARTLVYRGAIDDQHGLGYNLSAPKRNYLRDALDQVLEGRQPAVPATWAPGCVIDVAPTQEPTGDVTYHGRVERIVQRNCQECHRPGESGPFPLMTYRDVKGNAAMIRLMVERRLMPPWFATHESGPFSSDRSLSDRDRQAILDWIDGGTPKGDRADAPLPRKWVKGWRIGEPDEVVQVPKAFRVPAEGVVRYRYVNVPTDFGEDKWIKAFEVRPEVPEVVHHILVFARYPKDHPRATEQPNPLGGLRGYFAAMVPGQGHLVFPDGVAKFLPRGTTLRFQIHYTPNGTAVKDRPKLGLIFNDGPPKHELRTRSAFNARFEIPPNADNHRVTATYRFTDDARILVFMPHMHVRGKAFRYELQYPDGRKETVLDVPRYDFNWQLEYRLREPLDVPDGTRLVATAWYDNSDKNPANPDPTKPVHFGEQTWEEMMIGYFDWYPLD